MKILLELRRHWLLLIAALCGGALVNLPTYGLGIFMPIWEAEFGWTRSQMGLALTFFIGGLVLTSPIAGWVADRFGAKRPILLSTVMIALGLLLISRIGPQLWTLYAAFAAFALLASTGTMVTYSRAITQNFYSARGLALGIATSATGLALFTSPLLYAWLSSTLSWRSAWAVSAIVPLLLLPLLFLGIKDSSSTSNNPATLLPDSDSGITFRKAASTYRFYAIAIAFLLVSFAVAGASFQMTPILRDKGLTLQQAVELQAILAVGLTVARFGVGLVIDHVFAPLVFATLTTLAALGFLGIIAGPSGVYGVSIFFIGMALGAEGDVLAYICSKYFGLQYYAKIFGVLFALMNCGAMLTPVIYGFSYDMSGSYNAALWGAVAALTMATAAMFTLGGYPREAAHRNQAANDLSAAIVGPSPSR